MTLWRAASWESCPGKWCSGSGPRAALVVQGLIRVYMTSLEGRQVTVRYARPGDVLGIAVLVGGPANVGVQAVAPSSLFRISSRALTAAARRDARMAWAVAEELNRRLYATLQQTAVNAFGSVRQRVAAHLLDLASAQQQPRGPLVAAVSFFFQAEDGIRDGRVTGVQTCALPISPFGTRTPEVVPFQVKTTSRA